MKAKAVDDIDDAVEVQPDNPTAVSVALNDGEATVTGRRIGSAVVTIVTDDGALSTFTLTVQPADAPELGAYPENDGFPLRQGSS